MPFINRFMESKAKNNMRIYFMALLFAVFVCFPAMAQTRQVYVFTFKPGSSDFSLDYANNRAELGRLKENIRLDHKQIYGDTLAVFVDGYAASGAGSRENLNLAFVRCNRIKSALITEVGMREEFFITHNYAAAYGESKDVARVEVRIPAPEERLPANIERRQKNGEPVFRALPAETTREEAKTADAPVVEEKKTEVMADDIKVDDVKADVVKADEVAVDEVKADEGKADEGREGKGKAGKAKAGKVKADKVKDMQPALPAGELSGFSLRTNLLLWLAAVPNIGAEYRPTNSFGILLNGGWNHWAWKDGYGQDRTFFLQPEARYYIGKRKSFFVGLEGHFGQFDFKFGKEKDGAQGNFAGGGITGGYRLSLSRAFDLDFSLGLGYTRIDYETYYRSNDVFVRREGGLRKNFFGPSQAGVSLIFKL
jgi:ribosomal protein L25 (general stress protein Ctc)